MQTNIPYTGRSHFDGQNLMESVVKFHTKKNRLAWKRNEDGWLTGQGLALALPMPLLIRGVPMNNNYFPVGRSLPYPATLELIKQAYKEYDEKL